MLSEVIDNEIIGIQNQVAEMLRRASQLKSAQRTIKKAVVTLKDAINCVQGFSPDVLADLRYEIISLFDSDGGTTNTTTPPEPTTPAPVPEPEPQPTPEPVMPAPLEEPEPKTEKPRQATCEDALENSYCEFVLLEDAEIGYFKRKETGEIISTYAGFRNKKIAEQWGKYLVDKSVASKAEVRSGKRITSTKYELKIKGMRIKAIEKLATKDLSKPPVEESQLPAPEVVEVEAATPTAPAQANINYALHDAVEITTGEFLGKMGNISDVGEDGAIIEFKDGSQKWFSYAEIAPLDITSPAPASPQIYSFVTTESDNFYLKQAGYRGDKFIGYAWQTLSSGKWTSDRAELRGRYFTSAEEVMEALEKVFSEQERLRIEAQQAALKASKKHKN